ncbi:NACHT domain-containing protein [Rhizobium leguminosarum]|uniref:NACHT domain-containing protein n=1 Tax=Rhizobium leguminosarum TaxID=384 RepID=UPI001C95CE88|nr:hypothetical protein [Rhizobium leguminosarum]MBY5660451.1 hypothetical protein [Rhizobium leguminosarum]MBY5674074.1 hypothetical protein [Rhizobium leguminosarum]
MADFYINRRLTIGLEHLTEREVLGRGSVFVVLAEPGAGKTELLGELGRIWGVPPVRASLFRHTSQPLSKGPLIIDAVDEVAKIDQSAIDQIVVRAREACDGRVVFASRSSEWADDRTRLVKDWFGTDPVIVRIESFSYEEQERLFESYLPGETFKAFSKEVDRFGLLELLGNPQFLKLFADAYVQSGHRFSSKAQIFEDAVDRLALEVGSIIGPRRAPNSQIVAWASEMMAKLLLSGASGASTKEHRSSPDSPYLPLLLNSKVPESFAALDTRLFKPASDPDHHEPVHRIVAEYCAARYIAGRISDPRNPLSLRRVLALIAPNAFVRDELRGLLGWMATIGSEDIQTQAIELDAYAVLGNGDPSRFTPSSKRRLLSALEDVASDNPGFRRSDLMRKFSVSGFFTEEVALDVNLLLNRLPVTSPLTDLLLELMVSAGGPPSLSGEVRKILHDASAEQHTRIWASRALFKLSSDNPVDDFRRLVAEATPAALGVAVDLIAQAGADRFSDKEIAALFDTFIRHAQRRRHKRDDAMLMTSFDLRNILGLFPPHRLAMHLDRLTNGLTCTCGRSSFECVCRRGVSKMAGRLLDRYFADQVGPHHPARVWQWIRELWFEHQGDAKTSAAIQVLASDVGLRHHVHRLAFAVADGADAARDVKWRLWDGHHHSGLFLRDGDDRLLADFAFETDDVALWSVMWARHPARTDSPGPNEIRSHLRKQAAKKPLFAAEWAQRERVFRDQQAEDRSKWKRRRRRRGRRSNRKEEAYRARLLEDRGEIESGTHFGWVDWFAGRYLSNPETLTGPGERAIAEAAIRNCLPHFAAPPLRQLAADQPLRSSRAAFAACWIHFRELGGLDHVDRPMLVAAYVASNRAGWMQEDEFNAFERELDRLVFRGRADLEAFARGYIEPGLEGPREGFTNVSWLARTAACADFRADLALEWLSKFPDMPSSAQDTLFNLAIGATNRQSLLGLIADRAASETSAPGSDVEPNTRTFEKRFWRTRRFFFEDANRDGWSDLDRDPNVIFDISEKAGRYGDRCDGWPTLSAEKIYKIFDAFVEAWPQVPLPSSWGTGDPDDERAYRFLSDEIWRIARDLPERALPVLDKMIADTRFVGFSEALSTMRAETLKKLALANFATPSAGEVASMFDATDVASVEDLRAYLVEQLEHLQGWLRTAETDALETYYRGELHVDENTARNRVVDSLKPRMTAMNMPVVIEHHVAGSNRCDFTVSAMIEGRRRLLVIEAKGQWHPELFSAASAQLNERYASHQDAERQGIYLVFWFGPKVKVADRVGHHISTARELRDRIEDEMPAELKPFINVVVLDLSRRKAPEN